VPDVSAKHLVPLVLNLVGEYSAPRPGRFTPASNGQDKVGRRAYASLVEDDGLSSPAVKPILIIPAELRRYTNQISTQAIPQTLQYIYIRGSEGRIHLK
jgi:hypothetical protein